MPEWAKRNGARLEGVGHWRLGFEDFLSSSSRSQQHLCLDQDQSNGAADAG